MNEITVSINEIKRSSQNQTPLCTLSFGEKCKITVIEKLTEIIEFDETLFSLKSSVLLPFGPDTEEFTEQCIPGVSLIEATLKFLENGNKKMLVAGHTDTSGTNEYNIPLSKNRAGTVFSAITGDRELFKIMSDAPHISKKEEKEKVLRKDKIAIADWAAKTFGWNCSYKENSNYDIATFKAFQREYNSHSHAGSSEGTELATDGDWGPLTWGAVFDCYELDLAKRLSISREELKEYRSRFKWDDIILDSNVPYTGCGEYHPIDMAEKDNYRSQENRRVEVYFFDRDEKIGLECFNGGCAQEECDLFKKYKRKFIPVRPMDPESVELQHISMILMNSEELVAEKSYTISGPSGYNYSGATTADGLLYVKDIEPGEYTLQLDDEEYVVPTTPLYISKLKWQLNREYFWIDEEHSV